MPFEADQVKLKKIKRVKEKLNEAMYHTVGLLEVEAWVTKEPVAYTEKTTGSYVKLSAGERWGELWDCAWFHFAGVVPAEAAGARIVLLIDVNGELCLVDESGSPRQGLTNINSEFEYALGLPGKRVVDLLPEAAGGERIELWGDAGCNDLFGHYRSGTLKEAVIAVCHDDIRSLYYDFEVLLELAERLAEDSARKARIVQALYDASNHLSTIDGQRVSQAAGIVARELVKQGGDPDLTVSAIGHAHMDLAWLWPIRETIRKGARTFSTVLRNMEKYPEYIFGASQPQLYQWMKDSYPKLYQEIKERIEEGRWEPQGAMWVEPDTNISGGEALVRQILYGKRFFEQEFGQEMKVLWLPDVFGYTGSLPQILVKSGVDYMMTQKLSWSEYNDHPHHSFYWEGIDGTRVLTHLPPEDTYNSPAAPRSLVKIEHDYLERNVSSHALMLFGIGDGGGGPGVEHLERLAREHNLSGLPPVIQESSLLFFQRLEQEAARFETYKGELYLEKHQGTLTTQARNKWYNRKLEKALRELEYASSLLHGLGGSSYPVTKLEEIWKEVLLYQFHDILPGSSITRVYDESLERYAKLYDEVYAMISKAYAEIAGLSGWSGETAVFNSLPWERKEWVRVEDEWLWVTVPGMSYLRLADATGDKVIEGLAAADGLLANSRLTVRFSEAGHILSVYDTEQKREAVYPNAAANVFTVYEDNGDAWDFPHDYRETVAGTLKLTNSISRIDGPQAIMEQHYQYGESTLVQKIILAEDSDRIVFQTVADWKESDKMLRVSFPVNIASEHFTSDIQFGRIKRPTTRNTMIEFAKDEVAAHHYIDLSQPDYGVALLNDSKYGHSVRGHVMDLNLLRSPASPDPVADRAVHQFTYALYPHAGDSVPAAVYRKGYELNIPLTLAQGDSGAEIRREPIQLIQIGHPAVMLESVKKAEDSDYLIFRLYETCGTRARTAISLGLDCLSIEECDLMERPIRLLQEHSAEVELEFTPFEIKSIRVLLNK
ncbi:glycoside hydrolase family 38 C-terminal domain-containing protein [Paenibacillus sp. FSL H7-0716]|uniref:Alpha-mannosidase n=1 Tax=Paenibacillus odorifer TaxID=189426 RepID=A0A1R0Y827_9BACL|nr:MULTISPECIES: glycoside hydrolase family 38 C-terminal domain-containing protein [Paenibacillus]AIQ37166.1 alpha-mannosidase [Paenibacillus sp. FSL R5-0345]OMD43491.1 alpha-mannosidase [Paenibacillus odorifer]OME16623.1 alpha-mannosidase [Paenibacillus odorifer]